MEPGILCVTNRRVIFCQETETKQKTSLLIAETRLDQVTGIRFFEGKACIRSSFSRWAYLLMGQLLALAALFWVGTVTLNVLSALPNWLAPVLFAGCFVAVAIVVLTGRRTRGDAVYLRILTQAGGTLVSFSNHPEEPSFDLTLFGHEPENLSQLATQLGAMLTDLREMGDAGVAKWEIAYPEEPDAERGRDQEEKPVAEPD